MKNIDNICPECRECELVRGKVIAKCPGCGWWQFITPNPFDVAVRLSRSNTWLTLHISAILVSSVLAATTHEPWLSAVAGALFLVLVLVAFGARIKHDDDTDNGNNLDA